MELKLSSSRLSALASLLLAGPALGSGFLATGPGARAAAMGGAFTGLADDPSAVFYNPAGLPGQRGALMFEQVPVNESGTGLSFNDGRLDFVALQFPSAFGTFGVAMDQFAVGGIEQREALSDAPVTISASQTAYFAPYAVSIGRLSLGATAKAVRYSLGSYAATGYGADLGAKATVFEADTALGRDTKATLGAAIRNALSPTLRLYQDATPLERVTAFGAAVTASVRESYDAAADRVAYDRLSVSLDASRGNLDTPLGVALGLEYAYLGRYAVRAGYSANGDLTFGVGASNDAFSLDYGADLAALAPQHRVSISWRFTATKAPVEGPVHLSAYRRALLDQQRLKERFLREGHAVAEEGDYAAAYAAFSKACVLDPADPTVPGLLAAAEEGKRRAGVKATLDGAARAWTSGDARSATELALKAVEADPANRQAADYSVQLRNAMISTGAVEGFDGPRSSAVNAQQAAFDSAEADRSVARMKRAFELARALSPDAEAAWKPLRDKLDADMRAWAIVYSTEAAQAAERRDAVGMARAVRRLARLNAADPAVASLRARLQRLSRRNSRSFYDADYLRQLYAVAAAYYALGDYSSASGTLSMLLRENAAYPDAEALIDRMRDEGVLSDAQEP